MSDTNDSAEGIFSRERGLLTEFQFAAPQPNLSGSQATAIAVNTTATLASLSGPTALHIDDVTDRVWLTGTVGWVTPPGLTATILLQIRRDNPLAGPIIFSTQDAGAGTGSFFTTSFSHVDFPAIVVPGTTTVSYFLTATATGNALTIVGPLTLTGAEIERNRICNP